MNQCILTLSNISTNRKLEQICIYDYKFVFMKFVYIKINFLLSSFILPWMIIGSSLQAQ